jgi:hypothetical protein
MSKSHPTSDIRDNDLPSRITRVIGRVDVIAHVAAPPRGQRPFTGGERGGIDEKDDIADGSLCCLIAALREKHCW